MLFTEADIARYEETVQRALAFLRRNVDKLTQSPDLHCHYKAPYLYAGLGDKKLSRKYLDLIVSRYLQTDGDFRTGADFKGWPNLLPSPANRYVYSNGWIVVGLQKMGAYGPAKKGLDFIRRFQSADLGGFCSRYDVATGRIDQRYVDTSSTSSAGLALLACGAIDEAVRAGDFVLQLLDAQPDMNRHFFSSWDRDSGLMTDVFGDDDIKSLRGRKQFCLSAEADAAGEQIWLIGKPAMFLAQLYDATREKRYLAGADALFEFFPRLSDSRWQNLSSCKVMWSGSELYRLTGDVKYAQVVKRIVDFLHQSQCEGGSWMAAVYFAGEDQPFEMSADIAQELAAEINDVIFNVTSG